MCVARRWPCVYARRVLRRVLLIVLVACQLTAGMPVSLAETQATAGMDMAGMDMAGMDMTGMDMTGMDATHCPDLAQHQHSGSKHGCCSDGGCQCAVTAALPATPPPLVCRVRPPRMSPESDIRTRALRIDLFLRPPIA